MSSSHYLEAMQYEDPIRDRHIDGSMSFVCWLACLPFTCGACPFKTVLSLEQDEVTKTDVDLCGTHIEKRAYGDLGSVSKSKCCCCVSVSSSGLGEIQPGCGCSEKTVDQIVQELKVRIRARGETAQIQKSAETLQRLEQMDAKIDAIIKYLNIPPESMKMDQEIV